MIFDALTIAGGSLTAHQRAMDVVSHNIANANTPGYSRQISTLATLPPDKIGMHNMGRGVDLHSINRVVDPLIYAAQRENSSQFNFYDTVAQGLRGVESVFGSLQSTGLAAGLDDFFMAWQNLANNPQDPAQSLNVRATGENVTTMISNMHKQLSDARTSADNEIDQQLTRANQLITEIATLNAQIRSQESASFGGVGQANDLRDRRDQAVRDLSAIIPVQQVATNDNSLLLQTMGGDLLVHDDTGRTLARSASVGASGFREVVIGGTNTPVAGLDRGGVIGGLIELRDNQLGGYISSLDSIAANLVFAVNQVNASGTGSARMSAFTSGQGVINPALSLDDAAQGNLFASQIQSGSFTVHLYDATGNPVSPGGTAINITAGVTTMADVASQLNAITGVTASVDVAGRLVVDAGTNTLGFSGDSSNFLATYEVNTFFHGQGAGGLTLSSDILANASLISTGAIDPLTSAVNSGDNSSAIAVLAIQNSAISFDGSAALSLHDRTTTLSGTYGTDVAIADQQLVYRQAESESLARQREAISGVNVDEELITMIKYQRAYEAAAKVVSTTNTMLDSLMGIVR